MMAHRRHLLPVARERETGAKLDVPRIARHDLEEAARSRFEVRVDPPASQPRADCVMLLHNLHGDTLRRSWILAPVGEQVR